MRAAAEVVFQLGVARMSIERVRTASGASRSQVYRYFPAKEALIDAVVDSQIAAVLAQQRSLLASLGSLKELHEWADEMVELNRPRKGARGFPLGSLVSHLAEQSGAMRAKLEDAFQTWQSYLAAGLRRVQERGELNAEVDVAELATGIVAALQGGLILAQAARSEKPLRAALDLAVGRVVCSAPPPTWHAPADSKSGRASAAVPNPSDVGRSRSKEQQ